MVSSAWEPLFALVLGSCIVLPLLGLLSFHLPKSLILPSSFITLVGVGYISGGQIKKLIVSQLQDAASGETVEAKSVLEQKDSTDWGKLNPLLEQASNNLWFLVIVLAICALGARLVYKALFDAAGGVGLAINEDEGRWVVIGVQEGGAAHRAGMSKGDVITDVDGKLVSSLRDRGLRSGDVMRGRRGTTVSIGFRRYSSGSSLKKMSVEMVRGEAAVPVRGGAAAKSKSKAKSARSK